MQGMSFRPRKGDDAGERLAERLASDERLDRALQAVHFEEIRVEPDGRAVIRHMGGSLVWLLFPPMTRPIAISAEQIGATAQGSARSHGPAARPHLTRTRGQEPAPVQPSAGRSNHTCTCPGRPRPRTR